MREWVPVEHTLPTALGWLQFVHALGFFSGASGISRLLGSGFGLKNEGSGMDAFDGEPRWNERKCSLLTSIEKPTA